MTAIKPDAVASSVDTQRRNFAIGMACGLLVVVMWSAWVVATRFAVTTRLSPYDVAFIRYVAASMILSPVLVQHGFPLRKLGIGCTLLMVCGAGLPFFVMSSTGMSLAPASAAGRS
jgi:drug/metabolite transporter (DMT)-like permease